MGLQARARVLERYGIEMETAKLEALFRRVTGVTEVK
jgi:hypothetical protein